MSRWEGVEEFVEVVNSGSFSAAAEVLGISKSHVSQQISRIEERLGSRLLHRTTRKLSLTEVGEAFYQKCSHIVEAMDEAETSVTQLHQSVKGTLKIASPFLLGETFLVPAISEFMLEYPELELEIEFTSRRVDLLENDHDVALQVGARKDVNVVNVPLSQTRFYVVASKDYIQRVHKPVTSPRDLQNHQCLLFMEKGRSKPWRLKRSNDQSECLLKVKSRWRSNSGLALRAVAKRGLGIAYLPDYYLQTEVLNGSLRVLLPEWSFNQREIVAIYPHKRLVPAKVKIFTEFLKAYFQRPENQLQIDSNV
ncbi:LysR family transcriptional regulator [Aliikangiella sp. G2MR2-5]|uniref:LysR family transcriptional regulator n=1 Tax=Aliikangiella sp. G2MR2-5 TaxID=2788943 RepID=UPI0018A91265|nr:LysR family transcriptional regulator [Aliikangiella sp. G2MR2-5]